MPEDYKLGKFEDGFILPKEKFSKSLMRAGCCLFLVRHAFGLLGENVCSLHRMLLVLGSSADLWGWLGRI